LKLAKYAYLLSMLIFHVIVAGVAVAAVALRPHAAVSVVAVTGAAAVDAMLGADLGPAVAAVLPLACFLTAALSLAALVERSGLCDRAATALARRAGGRTAALYVLVCALCAALTAVVSLDGAVVLMVPLVLALRRRFGAPFAPLFVGVVAVANPVSIAVPQGNPTNLVVMERLGLSPAAFTGHLLLPGLAAAAACALGVALMHRRAVAGTYALPPRGRSPLSGAERHAAVALAVAGLVAWICPLAGVAPWWPFAAAVALALLTEGSARRVIVPWRLMVQVAGLVVVVHALRIAALPAGPLAPAALLAVALGIGAVAAIANNLPASVWAASLLVAGPAAYAATIGLAVGALATPQGSVATLVAADLAGGCRELVTARRLAPLAVVGVVVACALLAAPL
jgi:arsenical pump membrane protein